MRRVIAIAAALGLVAALVAPTATFASHKSSFVGSFNIYYNSTLYGHITALLWPSSPDQAVSGSYSASSSGGSSVALPRDVVFSSSATSNKVCFNALEVGSDDYFAAFTGCFVEPLDGTANYVETWGQHMSPPTAPGGLFGFIDTYHYVFTVGKGTFRLTVG